MSPESTTSTAFKNLKDTLADYSLAGLVGWIDNAREYGVQIDIKPLDGNRVALVLHHVSIAEDGEGKQQLVLLASPLGD